MSLSKTWKQDVIALTICLFLWNFSILLAVIGIVCYLVFRKKIIGAFSKDDNNKEIKTSNTASASKESPKEKEISMNDEIFEAFQELGGTEDEREQTIKHIFADPDATVNFSVRYDFTATTRSGGSDTIGKAGPLSVRRVHQEGARRTYNGFVEFRILRSLITMEPKEKELLRTTLLLFNKGILNDNQYRYFLFAFVNGNGKAAIEYWKKHAFEEEGIKDGASCVKYYLDKNDASVDAAVNYLLGIIKNHSLEQGAKPLIAEIQNRLIGGGSWLSNDEITGSVFNGNSEYKLNLGHLDNTDTVLNYSGEGSLITIAPPGSGKTQCFVIPNMLSWQGAAVVLDIKGEIYTATSKWREKNVGKVFKFSPLDPNNSNSYNPLAFIRQEPDFIWEDSRFLADMMIVPSGASDPFWENMARDVLTAAIAYITFTNDPDDRAMSKVIDIVYGIGWDEMITSLRTNILVSAMRQTGHALGEMEKKQRDSILKTAQSSLSAWQGERIGKVTKKSDWNPLDLRNGNPTIYICINPNEIDSYLSVLRVFIAQHIRMLTTELPKRGTAPALFMLDELPRLKKMPPVDEALIIGRQYGIKLWMFAQSYGQLKEAYPNAEGLLGSCVVRTFMNLPLNDELTTKISEQLGYREGPLDASKQKLVEPLELAGPNYRDIILVLATNTKPAKVRKKFAYEDEELIERMN